MANTKSIDLEKDSTQYLNIANASQTGLSISGAHTLQFWFKAESLASLGYLIRRGNASNDLNYGVYVNTNGSMVYRRSASGTLEEAVTTTGLISTGTWYFIIATFDTTNGMVLYINNVSRGTDATTTNSDTQSAHFALGARNNAGSVDLPFDGLMDEAVVWNDLRGSTERSEAYNSGDGKIYVGDEANMQGYWRLEDDLLDTTSNNNDLSAPNGSAYSTDVPFTGSTAYELAVTVGAFTLTGIAAIFTYGKTLVASVGEFALTGIAALFVYGKTLAANVGAFTFTGSDTAFARMTNMAVTVGAFTLTGIAATFNYGKTLVADTGVFVLTGADAAIAFGRKVALAVGSFTLTGTTTVLTKGYNLVAGVGTFILTGIDIIIDPNIKAIWTNIAKNAASFTNKVKNSSIWTNISKP